MMKPFVPITSALAIVCFLPAPEMAAQEKVIRGDQPLPERELPDQNLTAEDFRETTIEETGWPLELTLGLLFFVGIVILSLMKRRRLN